MSRRFLALPAVAALAAVVLVGCSDDDGSNASKSDEAVPSDTGSVLGGDDVGGETGDDGTVASEDPALADEGAGADVDFDGELPEGFPGDVPLLDGEIFFSTGADGTYAVTLSIDDTDVGAVYAEAKALLEEAGFAVVTEDDLGEVVTAEFAGDAGEVGISALADAVTDQTSVTYRVVAN